MSKTPERIADRVGFTILELLGRRGWRITITAGFLGNVLVIATRDPGEHAQVQAETIGRAAQLLLAAVKPIEMAEAQEQIVP